MLGHAPVRLMPGQMLCALGGVTSAMTLAVACLAWSAALGRGVPAVPGAVLVPLHHPEVLSPLRYAFTVMANITVYGLAWLLLNFQVDQPDHTEHLGIQDVPIFRVSGRAQSLGSSLPWVGHGSTGEVPEGVK